MRKKYFVPLDINKEHWDMSSKIIFLDKFFEMQLCDEEKEQLDYSVLAEKYPKFSKYEIECFVYEILYVVKELFNAHHSVRFEQEFWNNLLQYYITNFTVNIFSKTEDLENLKKEYNDVSFSTSSSVSKIDIELLKNCAGLFYSHKFNIYIFSKLAEKFFNFDVVFTDNEERINAYKSMDITNSSKLKKKCINNVKIFLSKLKSLTFRKFLIYSVLYLKNKINNMRKTKLGLWSTYFTPEFYEYILKKTHGTIKNLSTINVDEEVTIDYEFRNEFRKGLFEYFGDNIDLAKKAVLFFLPDFIPLIYIENFKKNLSAAEMFLKKNEQLNTVFATCLYCVGTMPFILLYANYTKKIRLLTEQHGGNYGISEGIHNVECKLVDTFYGWGNWVENVTDVDIEMKAAHTYRLAYLFDAINKKNDYILFIGSSCSYEISSLVEYQFGHIGTLNYINETISFFKELNRDVIKKCLVRNYYIDFGYHIDNVLSNEIPDIKIQGYKQKNYNQDFNPVARNKNFQETLCDCCLMITDEFETCFIEALYAEKPVIVIYNGFGIKIRKEELPFFRMMEEVGLFFYDYRKAAKLVNEIHNNINEWWFDSERQKVVQIIKERYVIKVPDIKKWWYKEFMNQIKISRKELKGRRR